MKIELIKQPLSNTWIITKDGKNVLTLDMEDGELTVRGYIYLYGKVKVLQ